MLMYGLVRIYVELSDAYKMMDPASNAGKRRALAEHLRESIDSLEAKVTKTFFSSEMNVIELGCFFLGRRDQEAL
jgi:hypothetical protein